MYAVIRSGGKQYRVQVGDVVRIERLAGDVGSALVFDEVLAVGGNDAPTLGQPTIGGASVRASITGQGRAKKIHIYQYKRRKNSNRRRMGHRQNFTSVKIEAIDA